MSVIATCPLCGRDDAIAAKDEPRFYVEGHLTAICFRDHSGHGPVLFDVETGTTLRHAPMEPHELLYRAAEEDGARGFGAKFLATHCGIYVLTREAIQRVQPVFPTEKDWIKAVAQDGVLTVAPIYRGPRMVGLEVRIVEAKAIGSVTKWTRTLGERNGIYIADPSINPQAVVVFEGTWDAVSAAWDALENQDTGRYAFASCTATTPIEAVEETLKIHFPGVPVVILTDQDSHGKSQRAKLARLGTLACLKGCGAVKDYREANPQRRREALLEAVEEALSAPAPSDEYGLAKIARRALEGVIQAKRQGLRDIEAWRFGQRCAGICATRSGKRYFAVRARVNGQMPVSEGQHEFNSILNHRMMRQLRTDYPDLSAIVEGGATESHISTAWLPPQFVEDGRHWTEIKQDERKDYARSRGWEPWTGRDPGKPKPEDLVTFAERVRSSYVYVRIPGVPDSEVGDRVSAFCLATTLSALWAEERWQAMESLGFLPCTWFFGGPQTGKGTAAKIIALTAAGELRTYGSQRFDGAEGTWLTESVLHLPVCFRDELDQFLPASSVEDLKTYLAGEPLQLRKKFGSDMTVAPKPVVFSSNSLKINEDDEATKDRINLVQLEANPLSTKADRNRAFDGFYRFVDEGGRDICQRAGILLYRDFRRASIGPAIWTRSAVFDAAMAFVCDRLQVNAKTVMSAALAGKETAFRQGLPWFVAMTEYAHHELGGSQSYHEATAAQVWGINTSEEKQVRKLRRWMDQFEVATETTPLSVCGWSVELGPRSTSTSRKLIFRNVSNTNQNLELEYE